MGHKQIWGIFFLKGIYDFYFLSNFDGVLFLELIVSDFLYLLRLWR